MVIGDGFCLSACTGQQERSPLHCHLSLGPGVQAGNEQRQRDQEELVETLYFLIFWGYFVPAGWALCVRSSLVGSQW